jgi:hypothetical protein
MIVSIRACLLLAIGLSAWPQPAVAQDIAETARRWGLLGTWAARCNSAPSASNTYQHFVSKNGGGLVFEREFGEGKDSNEVLQATVERSGTIELLVQFKDLGQMRSWVLEKGRDGRIRTLSNHLVNTQEFSVRNGRMVGSGKAASWQTRCRQTPAPASQRERKR